MSMIKEFKAFAMRGNVVDLAVAVIIGGAFGKIVTSLVADVVTAFHRSLRQRTADAVSARAEPRGGCSRWRPLP